MRSKLMAALLVSEALHLLLFGLLADVIIDPAPRELVVNVSEIHDDDEIGNDPDLPLYYILPRIEDIIVPGPIAPGEAPPPVEAGRPRTR